jgi:two-component sensor histidine kinase
MFGMRSDALRLLRWLRRGALAVPALLVVVFAVASWQYNVERAREQARENAIQIAEYTLRLIQTQDVMLTAADEALRQRWTADELGYESHLFLRQLYERLDAGLGIALISPAGDFLVSSLSYPAQGNTGPRTYIDAAAAGAFLFVDRLRVQPADTDALIIARRRRGDSFTGVWVSALEIEVISGFLRRIIEREGDAASVIRGDGRLLVRNFPMTEIVMLDATQPSMQAIRAADRGIFEALAVTDGVYRIYAFERVGDLPLYATYGISRRALVLDWAVPTGVVALLLGAIGVAGHALARYAARNVEAEAAQAALAFDRRLLEEAQKTAAIKEEMLREINHRVKNSLQMIQSLINLQRSRESGPNLDEIAVRVMAIAEIHDLLYRSSGAFDVEFAQLLKAICDNPALIPPGSGVTIELAAEPLELDVGIATPLALCVVELITNAAKHAYGPAGGPIRVGLRAPRDEAREAELTVGDGGAGMPESPGRRSGLRVVEALVRQLEGAIEVCRDGGTCFTLRFPVEAPALRRV